MSLLSIFLLRTSQWAYTSMSCALKIWTNRNATPSPKSSTCTVMGETFSISASVHKEKSVILYKFHHSMKGLIKHFYYACVDTFLWLCLHAYCQIISNQTLNQIIFVVLLSVNIHIRQSNLWPLDASLMVSCTNITSVHNKNHDTLIYRVYQKKGNWTLMCY